MSVPVVITIGVYNPRPTDQDSQFAGLEWFEKLKDHKIKISMDGKGRWMDNVFIERLWRSLKYECAYLYGFEGGKNARQKIDHWMEKYNKHRPHSALDGVPQN